MEVIMENMKWFVMAMILIAFLVGFSFSFWTKNTETKAPKTLKVGETTLNIEIADTDAKRVQGLSGRENLADSAGLLFVFDGEGYYGFWMKDMNFPIDIVWLDKDKRVVHAEKNVLPETYPKIFNPPALSLYVLEVSAGFLDKNGIKIGDVAEF